MLISAPTVVVWYCMAAGHITGRKLLGLLYPQKKRIDVVKSTFVVGKTRFIFVGDDGVPQESLFRLHYFYKILYMKFFKKLV